MLVLEKPFEEKSKLKLCIAAVACLTASPLYTYANTPKEQPVKQVIVPGMRHKNEDKLRERLEYMSHLPVARELAKVLDQHKRFSEASAEKDLDMILNSMETLIKYSEEIEKVAGQLDERNKLKLSISIKSLHQLSSKVEEAINSQHPELLDYSLEKFEKVADNMKGIFSAEELELAEKLRAEAQQ